MVRIITLILLFSIVSCSSHSNEQCVLFNYQDFGPQAMSNETVGNGSLTENRGQLILM